MPQTQQFGCSNIVAEFQGFVSGGAITTRAAQNCQLIRVGVATGQFQLLLNNVTPDDANFLPQVTQFVLGLGEAALPVVCAFPPVSEESTGLPALNYIQFGFY